MGSSSESLPANREEYLKQLADEHQIDVSKVMIGLCDLAFSISDSKRHFDVWLDKAYQPKDEAEDKVAAEGEEASEAEEESKDEAEEETNEDRDYNEDRQLKP
jgi:hypothetical protein